MVETRGASCKEDGLIALDLKLQFFDPFEQIDIDIDIEEEDIDVYYKHEYFQIVIAKFHFCTVFVIKK